MITGLAFVAYAVRDMATATEFYRDVLGLKPGETFNDAYVEFTVGSAAFALDASPPPGIEPGTCSGAAFEVDDIHAERARLAALGVTISDVYDFPNCSACFAQDPDGNRFTLHSRRGGTGGERANTAGK